MDLRISDHTFFQLSRAAQIYISTLSKFRLIRWANGAKDQIQNRISNRPNEADHKFHCERFSHFTAFIWSSADNWMRPTSHRLRINLNKSYYVTKTAARHRFLGNVHRTIVPSDILRTTISENLEVQLRLKVRKPQLTSYFPTAFIQTWIAFLDDLSILKSWFPCVFMIVYNIVC